MTKKQKKILIRIIIAAVLLVVLHFVKISEEWYINLPLYVVPYLVIGYDILINAVKKIFHFIQRKDISRWNELMLSKKQKEYLI